MTAEYLLKDWLTKNNKKGIEVFSAGTKADSDISSFCMDHLGKLKDMGIDTSIHKRTQLTKTLLKEMDLVMAMDETHQNLIKKRYDVSVPLFNEIYKNEKTSIRVSPPGATGHVSDRLIKMTDYINEAIPALVNKIDELKTP